MTIITCVGGGPGGLFSAILLKQALPSSEITVVEKGGIQSWPGWGIVLPAAALDAFKAADSESYACVTKGYCRWRRIDIYVGSRIVSSQGHDFISLSRESLLRSLGDRVDALGIKRLWNREIVSIDDLHRDSSQPDLIVAADGANSRIRQLLADRFSPSEILGQSGFLWLGTTRVTATFNFVFVETKFGWFQAHIYPLNGGYSTFIVETPDENWRRAGLDGACLASTLHFCEDVFKEWLRGARLLASPAARCEPVYSRYLVPAPRWRRFSQISNRSLIYGNIALVGDAAHAVHFSIGAGTRLAIEDAVALRDAVIAHKGDVPAALVHYQEQRGAAVLRLQSAARNSTNWLENVNRYAGMAPEQFAYSLLTRSQRLGHAELKRRDPEGVACHERWMARQLSKEEGRDPLSTSDRTIGDNQGRQVAPMFLPFRLRDMRLANRVVVSPMATYSATDGLIGDFHLVHLGARALGGAGLLITEMTAVSPAARITPGCAGLYRPEHVAAWRHVTDFVHGQSAAKICLQLGHAGPKGSTKRGWEGMDEPLETDGWPVIGASPICWQAGSATPRAMDAEDMGRVRNQFVSATSRAIEAGFDMIELHAAHGYLLSAFLTPLTNKRTDGYGGSLANRVRFPMDVFRAMRAVWPSERPISVRISAHDWVEGGNTSVDAVDIARMFQAEGADLIDVSSGQTSVDAKPVYGRLFQTPFADRIRNEAGIATLAVGNITDPDQINTIIAAGRADLCALGRPHLSDPHFTLRAAAAEDFQQQFWPKPYLAAKAPFERSLRTPRQDV